MPSDDALFFARGAERFSVLEFSPHFPGYPAFVLGARALALAAGDAAHGVFLLSALAGLSIPLALGCWLRAAGAAPAWALGAAAAALLQPALPALSLAMLSDSLGLALWLWALVALRAERPAASGTLLGLCLAARPTYAVLAALPVLALAAQRPAARRPFAAALAAVGLASAAFVLCADGLAYISEGLRFSAGHFSIWGRGQAAAGTAPSWAHVVASTAGGFAPAALSAACLAFAAPRIDLRQPAELSALAAPLVYAAWIALAQNPENPRHAAPLLFLALAPAALGLARSSPRPLATTLLASSIALSAWTSARSVDRSQSPPPLAQAAQALQRWPHALLITQRGVETLRAAHPGLAILDAHYAAAAAFAAATAPPSRPVLRLSAAPLPAPWQIAECFPARFPAEIGLQLYVWRPEPHSAPGRRVAPAQN